MSASEAKRSLAAILAADAAGYSSMMAADERATVAALDAARAAFRAHIEREGGRVVDMAGDSILAVFGTATGAVAASASIQRQLEPAPEATPESQRLRFRIGLHLGEIIEKPDGTVYGDAINIAARLQALAEPGGIAVSDAVKAAVRSRISGRLVDQGEQKVKNIPEPVRWCKLLPALAEGGLAGSRAAAAAERTVAQLSELPSIAILPFRTAGVAPDEASLADGLRIDVQAALVKIAGMLVVGIGTTNSYRGKEVTPQQAAAEMGARHVLEGFIQRSGNRVRITVSLTDGSRGQVVWTERYDRELNDALEVQDEITERIVTALDVKLLSGEQAKVWRKTLRNPRVREYFYRGLHEYMKGQKEANAAARENFEQVARLATESSLGPTMVAFSHWWDAFRGWTATPAQSFDLAAKWAERAMSMEDADGQAHTVMAHIHLLRREHDQALKAAQDAVELRPSCSNANSHLANILYYCGRPADAADRMRQAIRITPVHPPWFEAILAASCKETAQWQDATAAAKEALRKKADDIDARLVLIEICQAGGDVEAARELVREVTTLRPDFSVAKWAQTQPLRDRAALDRIAANLRSAGLAP
jgi:adenylate cyclase